MEQNESQERKLILQARKDPEAFGALYDKYYEKIYRFILYRTSDRETAQDLTSETFFQALKNLWRFRFMRRPFSAWLYRIAVTQVAMYFRDKKKYLSVSLEEAPDILRLSNSASLRPALNYEIDNKQDRKILSEHLKKLSEVEQNIMVLRYFEEKSLREISKILRMNLNTVKSHLRRGLARLRSYYGYNNLTHYGESQRKFSRRSEAFEKK